MLESVHICQREYLKLKKMHRLAEVLWLNKPLSSVRESLQGILCFSVER